MEIYQALLTLGADVDQILLQHGEKLNKVAPWLVTFLVGHREAQRFEYKTALATMTKLEERFKGSPTLLLAMAHCHFKQVNMKDSYNLYTRVRASNRFILDSMDQLAAVIKFNGHLSEINVSEPKSICHQNHDDCFQQKNKITQIGRRAS